MIILNDLNDIYKLILLMFQLLCPNNKKKIYNDKYRHTRDRLLDLMSHMPDGKEHLF